MFRSIIMIVQEQIQMNIAPCNYEYWKEKGYPVSIGETISVKVLELSTKSSKYIKCVCDNCKKEFNQRTSRNTDLCGTCKLKHRMSGNNYGKNNIKYKIPPPDELIQLHQVEKKTIQQIALQYSVSIPVVYKWFEKHKIKHIKHREKKNKIPNKDELVNLHHTEKYTIQKIALHYKVACKTIKEWLKFYEIEIKKHRRKRKLTCSFNELKKLHQEGKMTLKEISEKFGVSDVLIGLKFKENGSEPERYPTQFKEEGTLRDFLNSYGFLFRNTRKAIGSLELDCYDEKLKFAVEYCGLHWHSEEFKPDTNYHFEKLRLCREAGINLITIFEDEWLKKQEIVKSILLNKLGIYQQKIYARQCNFQEIKDKLVIREFLNENHLQGAVNFEKAFGLLYNGELVACMTFGKHHRGNNDCIILSRLCFAKNISIVGGAKKLFTNAIKFIDKYIISWSDNRYSEGNVYKTLGFVLDAELPPDYTYIKSGTRHSKQSMSKKNIGCPIDITEREYCEILGYRRIWDCGKKRWKFI